MLVSTMGAAVLAVVCAAALPAVGPPAAIRTCIDPTLGSDYARRTQIWEYTKGRLTQPVAGVGRCLTATTAELVQGAPAVAMLDCSAALAANQTWELNANAQLVLAAAGGGLCVDVAGYSNSSGSPLHVWRCTAVPAVWPSMDGNQRWEWRPDGSVRSLMSGLCLDAGGSDTVPKTCNSAPFNASAYCNTSLSAAARAAALVAAANLTEQIANLAVQSGTGFPALGVPPLSFSEALHGVACGCGAAAPRNSSNAFASTGCATSFPHALSMAASYNRTMWAQVGGVIGREARALHNQPISNCGLAFFTPNINLYRDPRWGRGMETPGEDPVTAQEYAAQYVAAMAQRSEDGEQQRVVVGPKHFVDYDLEGRHDAWSPDWGPSRNDFNALVIRQEQVEYFLPAWHAAISASRAGGVMCSTNRVNGVDACMNPTYLNGFLRQRFGFEGYVVTDGNSCGNVNCEATVAAYNASVGWGNEGHQIAAELCIRGGTDIELGTTLLQHTAAAVAEGELSGADVARANAKVFEQFIKAGWLDTTEYDLLGPADVDTAAHRQLAYEVTQQLLLLAGCLCENRNPAAAGLPLADLLSNSPDDLCNHNRV